MGEEAKFIMVDEIDLSHIDIMDQVIAFSVIEDGKVCLLDQSGQVWSYDYVQKTLQEFLSKLPHFRPYTKQVEMVFTQDVVYGQTRTTIYIAGQGQWAIYQGVSSCTVKELKKLTSLALTSDGTDAYVLLPKTDQSEDRCARPLTKPVWEANKTGTVTQKNECPIWKMSVGGKSGTFFIQEEWSELEEQPSQRYSQRFVMAVMPSGLLYVVDTGARKVGGVTVNEDDVKKGDDPQQLDKFHKESQALRECIDFLGPTDRVVFFRDKMYVLSLEPGNYKLFILNYQQGGGSL